MNRHALRVLAAIALVAASATPVLAARQLGPDLLAKGRGSVETTEVVEGVDSDFLCDDSGCEEVILARKTRTTVVSQAFDFDARPAGHIKLTQTTTVTRTVTLTPEGETLCSGENRPQHCPPGGAIGTQTTTTTVAATANVTCLTVIQNRATIGGHVIRWSGDVEPTRGVLLNVTDNTIARQQVGGPDRFLGAFVGDVPYECPPPTVDHPISKGDIYVDQS